MKLWEWYWVNWGSTSDVSVLAGYEFGTWFVSGAFDDAWCLQWLRRYSEVRPQVEPDTSIMEKVAAIADAGLTDAMIFTDRYVRGDVKHWRVYGSIDSLKKILAKALASDNHQLSDLAVNLVDYLGRSGYMDFGTLLPSISAN